MHSGLVRAQLKTKPWTIRINFRFQTHNNQVYAEGMNNKKCCRRTGAKKKALDNSLRIIILKKFDSCPWHRRAATEAKRRHLRCAYKLPLRINKINLKAALEIKFENLKYYNCSNSNSNSNCSSSRNNTHTPISFLFTKFANYFRL